jgi:primosomal protein N'
MIAMAGVPSETEMMVLVLTRRGMSNRESCLTRRNCREVVQCPMGEYVLTRGISRKVMSCYVNVEQMLLCQEGVVM